MIDQLTIVGGEGECRPGFLVPILISLQFAVQTRRCVLPFLCISPVGVFILFAVIVLPLLRPTPPHKCPSLLPRLCLGDPSVRHRRPG